jgi:hypothetical protein
VTPPAAAAEVPRAARAGERALRARPARPPRRVSGPARRPAPARPAPRRAERGAFLLGLASALEWLASHRLIDRLIRGRAWLVLVTFALIGIVTLQLALLKLNGAVGRALRSEATLQREDAALSIENSELAASDHVQATGAQLGMAFASSSALRFLAPTSRGDFTRGAAALSSALRASPAGSEGAASGRGTGAQASEAGGEKSASEASSGEAHGEAKPAEGEGSGSSGEASATESHPSEAPATHETPPQTAEAPSGAAASPAGGTQATPGG